MTQVQAEPDEAPLGYPEDEFEREPVPPRARPLLSRPRRQHPRTEGARP